MLLWTEVMARFGFMVQSTQILLNKTVIKRLRSEYIFFSESRLKAMVIHFVLLESELRIPFLTVAVFQLFALLL